MHQCKIQIVDQDGNERWDTPTFTPLQGGRIVGMVNQGYEFILVIEIPR